MIKKNGKTISKIMKGTTPISKIIKAGQIIYGNKVEDYDNKVADIEQLIVSYFENKTVKEVES